ncbi:hypothetical protein NQZ68_035289 [Dissostichus eleginoides]|nr:hypothetical protein NQZ68_035289 [Dissostichus eleginoides]
MSRFRSALYSPPQHGGEQHGHTGLQVKQPQDSIGTHDRVQQKPRCNLMLDALL